MQAGTNGIPKALEDKLVEAKGWNTRRERLEKTIRAHSRGVAERDQEDRDDLAREGAELLTEIVEIIDDTWGFA